MPLYAAGQKIRGSEINALPQTYRVASDQVCNNSTTLRNVTGLAFQAEASGLYLTECFLAYASNTTANMKTIWTVPAGTTGWYSSFCINTGVGTPGSIEAAVIPNPAGFAVPMSGDATDPLLAMPVAYIVIGGTAGTVQLQFAQNAANASDTTIKAGSVMRVSRLA